MKVNQLALLLKQIKNRKTIKKKVTPQLYVTHLQMVHQQMVQKKMWMEKLRKRQKE